MTQHIAISVIVPIYNVEKYLERCLKSIKSQTFTDFEVIMTDDGSDDGSAEIAKSYAENDGRFLFFQEQRSGVAATRNKGLFKSRGEFIAFIDSDDYVEPDYLEILYNAAVKNECMISSCSYSHSYEGRGVQRPVRVRKLRSGVYTKEYYVKHVIRDWNVRSYLWNKLWHRSLFFDNNIFFPNMYFEDIATVARLAYNTNKVVIVDKPLYHYFVRSNSIMTSVKVEKINDYILSYGIVRNYIEYCGNVKPYKASLIYFAFIIYFANYYNIFKLHFEYGSFKGWFKNQHISNKNIIYFAKCGFKAQEGYPKLPQYIYAPQERKNKK